MNHRCYNPKATVWKYYGARGISVCERWRNSFLHFAEDMGPLPFKKATLERIDVNGNYEPQNCRWATQKEQARNTRANRRLTFQGKTQPIAAWAEELGISADVISARKQNGWSDFDALTRPGPERMITANGITKSLSDWEQETGIRRQTLWWRWMKGWTGERIISNKMTHQEIGKKSGALQRERFRNRTLKLTAFQISEIKSRYVPYSESNDLRSLANEFGVSAPTIHALIHGNRIATKP